MGKSLESNVKHMTTSHSFFIPDVEYLINLEGFITYLGMSVAYYMFYDDVSLICSTMV